MSTSTNVTQAQFGPSTGYGNPTPTLRNNAANAAAANAQSSLTFNHQNTQRILTSILVELANVKTTGTAAAANQSTVPRDIFNNVIATWQRGYKTAATNGTELVSPDYRLTVPEPNPNNLPPSTRPSNFIKGKYRGCAGGHRENTARLEQHCPSPPVISTETLNAVRALAVHRDMKQHQRDVTSAYLCT